MNEILKNCIVFRHSIYTCLAKLFVNPLVQHFNNIIIFLGRGKTILRGTQYPRIDRPGTLYPRTQCPGGHFFQGDNINSDTGTFKVQNMQMSVVDNSES